MKSVFARYLVRLNNNDISQPDKKVEVSAISADTAKKIAETFNKGFTAEVAIRLDKKVEPIAKQLETLANAVEMAESEGLEAEAMELRTEYNTLYEKVRQKMNVVSWNIVKTEIPELS